MKSKKPNITHLDGGKPNKKHLPKAGGHRAETQLQKTERQGKELLKKILRQNLRQMEILASWTEALETRMAFKDEIEKVVYSREFFEIIESREKISLLKDLDSSVLAQAALLQRLQAQGDGFRSFHNHKKMLDLLTSLEKESEIKATPLPYSPEFGARVRKAYADRVMGRTTEPENHNDEE